MAHASGVVPASRQLGQMRATGAPAARESGRGTGHASVQREMQERHAREQPSGVRAFVENARAQIIADWEAALGRRREAPTRIDDGPALIAQIAELAEHVARGESMERTFELARTSAVGPIDEEIDLPRRLAELSVLRGCVLALSMRPRGLRGRELRALDVAIDAVIAATVARAHDAAAVRHERVAAERERVLAKLESLLAAAPVGVAFLDRDLRYLRINAALASLNGRPAAEHIGRPFAEMIPEAAPVLEPILREVIATGQPALNRELTVSAPEGSRERHVLATFFPVRAATGEIRGVGGIVSDVSDLHRAAEDLRREQERIQSIIERTPAAVWVKEADGRIVLANHRLADALGHAYEDMIGRRSEELLPPEISAQHQAHDATVLREHRAIEVEETVPGPEGTRTFLSLKFPLPGEPPMVGGIATDITERKKMEEQLRDAIGARERMLAVVSHDLRNPLGTVQLASANLLNELGDDPYARHLLEIIQRSSSRMEHLIQDLLDTASIGAGRLSLDARPEPAAEIAREAVDLHQPLADEKGIAIVHRCSAEGARVTCDRHRVMQVLANLIGNALKFCRAGDTVTLGCERAEGEEAVRFWVEDTGPGVPSELLEKLFEPYWSGPDTHGGVGLGLFIARGIIERHGGRVSVESELDRGTRFSFTLPLARDGGV